MRRTLLLAALLTAGVGPAGIDDRPSNVDPRPVALTASMRLVANPGFEAGLASWSVDTASAVAVVASPVHGGTSAARLTDSSTTAGVSLRGAPIAVLPGEELTATAWVRRTAGSGGSLYLEFRRPDGARAAVTSVAAGSGSDWQQVTVRGTAPDEVSTATVLAYSAQAESGTTVWDDVAVSALAPPQRKVPNAAFEQKRDNTAPTEWTVDGPVSLAPGRTGLGVRTTDTSTGTGVSVLSRRIPAAAEERVTASVWANGPTGVLYLEFRDAADARLATPTANVPSGSGWKKISATGTAPPGTVALTIRLYSTQGATGTTTWDDVSIRSTVDIDADPALAVNAPVLFVGDQRIESYSGVARSMKPGVKGPADGVVLTGVSGWDANPRLAGSVLPIAGGYGMWYATTHGTGYVTSADGITWSRDGRTAPVSYRGNNGVVQNHAWTPGSSVPRYFRMRSHHTRNPNLPASPPSDAVQRYYYMEQSPDGIGWNAVPNATPIPGWDVANASWDPVTRRYITMIKPVPVDYGPPAVGPGPRHVWVSTSTDFTTWTAPRPAYMADPQDDALIPPSAARHGMTPWAEFYGMPAIRYGDQFLGFPWVFEIGWSPNRDNGDPGPDTGRQHIGLAASRDLVTWSRPDRTPAITRGGVGSWDYGFNMSGTTLETRQLGNGQWETRYWYGSFAGEHVCDGAKVTAGDCAVPTGNARIGLVTWPADRFQSFRGAGTVTTRPLIPAGRALRVNYDPGSGGSLRVEVLDAAGNVVLGPSDPVTTNATAPGVTVTWGATSTLPTGQIRLRFTQTGGDLYAFTVR
jgi:hypothetical protein